MEETKKTLAVLLQTKSDAEGLLEDALTYSEELEAKWNDNEIELAAKIDAYGFVIDNLESKVDFLKAKKSRINTIQKRFESEINRIKQRLNILSEGKTLEGNEYKFKPTVSITTDHIEMEAVEEKYKTFHLKMDYTFFYKLYEVLTVYPHADKTVVDNIAATILATVVKECKVSDLPKDHPALVKNIVPTVKVLH